MNYYYKPLENDEAKDKLLQQLIDYCNHNITIDDAIIKKFWIAVDSVLTSFMHLPKSNNLDFEQKETMNICVTFLRARMAEFDARYRIDLYNDAWFLFKQECTADWDLRAVHSGLFEEIRKARSRYATAFIPESEYSDVFVKACEVIKETVFQHLIRNIVEINDLPSYKDALDSYMIKLWVGDYMDQIDLIFSSDSGEG